ncbi:MAG: ATP-binding protein [Ignavibacteria bacterium]|nr:ATP-binding protein [Ignavibacteria bacterium]
MSNDPVKSYEIVIKNSPEEVSKAIYQFLSFCNEEKISLASIYKLRLAMEEILVNIINYSFQDKNQHELLIRINSSADNLTMEFIDDGIAFDPLTVPDPQDIPLEQRKPGGVGIYLVKTMMDVFKYKRIDGNNILTVSKKIT